MCRTFISHDRKLTVKPAMPEAKAVTTSFFVLKGMPHNLNFVWEISLGSFNSEGYKVPYIFETKGVCIIIIHFHIPSVDNFWTIFLRSIILHALRAIVIGMGNPWVRWCLPIPVPICTLTCNPWVFLHKTWPWTSKTDKNWPRYALNIVWALSHSGLSGNMIYQGYLIR